MRAVPQLRAQSIEHFALDREARFERREATLEVVDAALEAVDLMRVGFDRFAQGALFGRRGGDTAFKRPLGLAGERRRRGQGGRQHKQRRRMAEA